MKCTLETIKDFLPAQEYNTVEPRSTDTQNTMDSFVCPEEKLISDWSISHYLLTHG